VPVLLVLSYFFAEVGWTVLMILGEPGLMITVSSGLTLNADDS
jgi:hypothetical protein